MPANLTGLEAGNHALGTGAPTHTPVLREGVLTHVVFRGWSGTATTGIFAPGADGRPVPKTGDTANMSLWIMMFGLGLLDLGATSSKLALAKRGKAKSTMFVIKGDNGEDQHIILPN